MRDWYRLAGEGVLLALETDRGLGLTQAEAIRRMVRYGPSELIERGLKSPWRILWEQLAAALMVVLIVAAVIVKSERGQRNQ